MTCILLHMDLIQAMAAIPHLLAMAVIQLLLAMAAIQHLLDIVAIQNLLAMAAIQHPMAAIQPPLVILEDLATATLTSSTVDMEAMSIMLMEVLMVAFSRVEILLLPVSTRV